MAIDILILGGTTEARLLAEAWAQQPVGRVILSLAGRTKEPASLPIPTRSGGFGGIAGLIAWLQAEHCRAVIDATHPFAAQMGQHAAAACQALGLPLLRLSRPPWQPTPADRWIEVADMASAVTALGTTPRRVFLTVGRQNLTPFEAAPQHHYVIRTIDWPDPPPSLPHMTKITARGPFTAEDDTDLMRQERIDLLVSKNAGGSATEGKLIAARRLGVPVVMVARPTRPVSAEAGDIPTALAWTAQVIRRTELQF